MKVLYLYSGTRADKFKGKIGVDFPDTQFYGLNHLSAYGIDAEYKEVADIPLLTYFPGGFRLKHLIVTSFFALQGRYDIIFGSSLLYALFLKKIFRLRSSFAVLDISLGRTLAVNQGRRFKSGLIRWLISGADAIISLSRVQKESIVRYMPAVAQRASYVHLGVDVGYHMPVFTGRKKYFLSAGRDNGRDYRTIFELARLMPEEKFEVVCSARNLAGAGDIPPNVTVHVDLPHADLCVKFGEAEMLLLATHDDSHADGSDCSGQTVLLEALASGLPVIASRKKYLDDYAREGEDYCGVGFYDPHGIAAAIGRMRADGMAERVARHARKTAEDSLSTQHMARELADIFFSIQHS